MDILVALLYVVEVVSCLLLALVVMLQKPKEGGLGGLAGGMGEAVFGADAGNVLIKVTVWLGAIFLVNTLLLARFTSKPVTSVTDAQVAPVETQTAPVPQLPLNEAAVPAEPAAAPAPEKPAVPAAPAAAPAKPAAPAAPAAAPAKPAAPAVPAKPAAPKAN